MAAKEVLPERISKLLTKIGAFDTYESHEIGLRYKPGPTDIIISTAAKAGTTVTQQVRVILGGLKYIMRSLI